MKEHFTKEEWTTKIAADTGLTKAQARQALDKVVEHAVKALQEGKSVIMQGLGTLSVRVRKARVGRNPQTGAKLEIPEHKVIGFSMSKNVKV